MNPRIHEWLARSLAVGRLMVIPSFKLVACRLSPDLIKKVHDLLFLNSFCTISSVEAMKHGTCGDAADAERLSMTCSAASHLSWPNPRIYLKA